MSTSYYLTISTKPFCLELFNIQLGFFLKIGLKRDQTHANFPSGFRLYLTPFQMGTQVSNFFNIEFVIILTILQFNKNKNIKNVIKMFKIKYLKYRHTTQH